MRQVEENGIPEGSLLQQFAERPGFHVDAFVAHVGFTPSLNDYIVAMFDSRVFRIERALLALAAFKPTFKEGVAALAAAESDRLASWKTVQRTEQELLMEVEKGRVRTWLMVEPAQGGASKLWFGSAVVPKPAQTGKAGGIGFVFRTLMGFHKLYSRVLLRAAIHGLKRVF
ncbi:hypothetical protein [Phaeobacter porticola]|uniref:DUF2867 domain-containing protein n=1 Tax=Phaeobacter porticola TaxID=1844006 RepID=A0A1L3IAK8_9RHOB|nr:hypothetical protein [Phaeobacter porticola]APG49136.1 hypothetical protein PhaeoP97_03786 [Phaeobacter porticola]